MDNQKTNDSLSETNNTFDQLLDDFIVSLANDPSSDNAAADGTTDIQPETTGQKATASYTYQGVAYELPEKEAPRYRIRTLTTRIGSRQSIRIDSEHPALFLPAGAETLRFSVSLSIFEPDEANNPDQMPVYLALYREGKPAPLWQTEKSFDEDYRLDLEETFGRETLPPGNYFLLFGNLYTEEPHSAFADWNHRSCYKFELLVDGEALAPPCIRNASWERSVSAYALGGTGLPARMQIVLNEAVDPSRRFTAVCYNETLGRMAAAQGNLYGRERRLRLEFRPGKIWTEGTYFILLMQNEEPFARITYVLKKGEKPVCTVEPVEKGTLYHTLGRSLEKENAWAGHLQELPGLGEIRNRLVSLYEKKRFNDWRIEKELPPVHYRSHFLITGTDCPAKQKFAGVLPHFLGWQSTQLRVVNAFDLTELRNSADPYEETTDLLAEREGKTICIDHVPALATGNGAQIVKKFLTALRADGTCWSLALSGSESEIRQLFEAAPELESFFPEEHRFRITGYSLCELLDSIDKRLRQQSFRLSEKAQRKLYASVKSAREAGLLQHWDESLVNAFIYESMLPGMQRRLLKSFDREAAPDTDLLRTVEAQDIDTDFLKKGSDSFEKSMERLNELVGLQTVKESMKTAFTLTRFNEQRRQWNLPVDGPRCHHMIFTGNPGTGKTTVAKMVGKIYRSMGLLSKGDVIVSERGRLVGRYIGETEKNMQVLLDSARGNVLFIDEAYTLCDGSDNQVDFGHRAIESLLTALAEDDSDRLVILAGYEKEMNRMLTSNPGLPGRFPHKFHFEDYGAEELLSIGRNLLARDRYELTDEATQALAKAVADAMARKDKYFSNARWMEQFIANGILPAMAERVTANDRKNDPACYRLIEASDIAGAVEKQKANALASGNRRGVGYR